MLATTPTLRIAMIKKHQRWQELVVPRMAERSTGPRVIFVLRLSWRRR
jgi:hypothetical protein